MNKFRSLIKSDLNAHKMMNLFGPRANNRRMGYIKEFPNAIHSALLICESFVSAIVVIKKDSNNNTTLCTPNVSEECERG